MRCDGRSKRACEWERAVAEPLGQGGAGVGGEAKFDVGFGKHAAGGAVGPGEAGTVAVYDVGDVDSEGVLAGVAEGAGGGACSQGGHEQRAVGGRDHCGGDVGSEAGVEELVPATDVSGGREMSAERTHQTKFNRSCMSSMTTMARAPAF